MWPNPLEEVAFLGAPHRHEFHVKAEKVVSHNDRDIEFILLKRAIAATIEKMKSQSINWSCETWAENILEAHGLDKVEVSEDGENGAIVER
jgi:hypothetical protein